MFPFTCISEVGRKMHIVAGIGVLLASHCVLVKCSTPVTGSYTVRENLPSRLYLPTLGNPSASKLARNSDIETVLENDLRVIPLAADHDQRNGFQYQPIISRQYSPASTESPRHSQSVVPNLPQNWNTRRLGSPINNANEVKPITKSQLSTGTVAYRSTQKGNNLSQYPRRPSSLCLTPKFQTHYGISPLDQTPTNSAPSRKILTVNDQEDDTHRGRLTLGLTPPREAGISIFQRHRIDNVSGAPDSSRKLVAAGPWSKGQTLIDRDIKPVFEGDEYGTNCDNYKNYDYNRGDYQLGDRNTAGSFNGILKSLLQSNCKTPAVSTCKDIVGQFLPKSYQGYNYGFNTPQHPPPDPILALLLSHYGKYLPGLRTPRLYGYMAVNNIHNNKPFGSYKLTRDNDAGFIR